MARIDKVVNGIIVPFMPKVEVMVESEADLQSLTDYPVGTIAFTAGQAEKWQLDAAGEWADYASGGAWKAVLKAEEDGTYKDKYAIGDTIALNLGANGIVHMEIVAFDTDALADGFGTAKITWISKELLTVNHRMNPAYSSGTSGTGTLGGWGASEMREYLHSTIKQALPEAVRDALKTVTKYTRDYSASEQLANNSVSTDDLWIPSTREIFGTQETSGPHYAKFDDRNQRIKSAVNASAPSIWWTRTAYSVRSYVMADVDGTAHTSNAQATNYIALGFCT